MPAWQMCPGWSTERTEVPNMFPTDLPRSHGVTTDRGIEAELDRVQLKEARGGLSNVARRFATRGRVGGLSKAKARLPFSERERLRALPSCAEVSREEVREARTAPSIQRLS